MRERYAAVMRHYGMEPTVNNAGIAHENGDIEQAHSRFKEAVDQALRARGSRDIGDRAAYDRLLAELVRRRNATRQARWAEEQAALRLLPATPLAPCREVQARVGRFSPLQVLRNTDSVPSRLIGARVLVRVRVRAETLEVYAGTSRLLTMGRLPGRGLHRIDDRHVSHVGRYGRPESTASAQPSSVWDPGPDEQDREGGPGWPAGRAPGAGSLLLAGMGWPCCCTDADPPCDGRRSAAHAGGRRRGCSPN